jgi:Zn-dependent peptidase ImmA (M78 family)
LSKTTVKDQEEVEEAAEELREQWDLGQDPIYSIISLMEEHEIKVIEIDEDLSNFDGLSAFVGEKYPVIVVNKNMPVERKRFTLLHELAHLLLNISDDNAKQDREKFCHRFAGAVLLPRAVVWDQFGKNRNHITFNELFSVQRHFGISVSAIIYRLYHNKVISQEMQRRFFIQINQDRSLKDQVNLERYKGDETTDRYEKLVYRALAQEQISTSKAAAMLGKSVEEIRDNFAVI